MVRDLGRDVPAFNRNPNPGRPDFGDWDNECAHARNGEPRRRFGTIVRRDGPVYPTAAHIPAVDGLFTNFHLPRSSLFVLVSAFAGIELIRKAYETAIRERYRFYSYGDSMLIV